MKKAFSMIELIVAMLILAFVFAVVPMILATTASNTKTMLGQDKAIKLGELYSVLKLLPYQNAANNDYYYTTASNYKMPFQNRASSDDTQAKIADEFLGDSDKFVIKSSSSGAPSGYTLGNNLTHNTDNAVINFSTGYGRTIQFELNSHSSQSKDTQKWDLYIDSSKISSNNDITLSVMTLGNKNKNKAEGVKAIAYFANTGRKDSRFYNEMLPFTDSGNAIASMYEQQLNAIGVTTQP